MLTQGVHTRDDGSSVRVAHVAASHLRPLLAAHLGKSQEQIANNASKMIKIPVVVFREIAPFSFRLHELIVTT